MAMHEGVVETVNLNKAGYYSIKLPDAWYGTGSKSDPGLRQGDMIKFEWEANGNFRNIKKGTLAKVEGAPAGNAQPRVGGYIPDNDRQKSIVFQSSRKDAIEALKLAQTAGVLALPAKKGDAFDALMALIDETTVKYANTALECNLEVNNKNEGDKFDG